MEKEEKFHYIAKQIRNLTASVACFSALVLIISLVLIFYPKIFPAKTKYDQETDVIIVEDENNKVINGIHVRTGLKAVNNYMIVVNNCTNCHSAKLIIQNRMSKEEWMSTIRWMQEKHNLWDLGKNEQIIVDYLVKNYRIEKKRGRAILKNIDWYEL